MALSSTNSKILYTGDGSTKIFPIPYQFIDPTDIRVTITPSGGSPSVNTLGADYSVSGGDGSSGEVAMIVAPVASAEVKVERIMSPAQVLILRNQGPYFQSSIERGLDRVMMLIQQLNDGALTQQQLLQGGVVDASVANVLASGASTPRTLASRAGERLSVMDFGAVGDGVANDTAPVQAAGAAATAGTEIYFPAGIYNVSATGVSWSGLTRVTFRGSNATIKFTGNGTKAITGLTAGGFVLVGCTGCVVKGLRFDNTGRTSNGFALDGCTDTEVSNNEFVGGSANGALITIGGTRNRLLFNRVVASANLGIRVGHYSPTSSVETDPLVQGNIVTSSAADGIGMMSTGGTVSSNQSLASGASGIIINGANGVKTTDLVVVGNTFRGSVWHGIQADVSSPSSTTIPTGVQITGNVVTGNAIAGIYAVNVDQWSIIGNTVKDNLEGIYLEKATNTDVVGNKTFDSRSAGARTQTIGIHLLAQSSASESSNVSIIANSARNHTSHGIHVQTSGSGTAPGVSVLSNSATGNSSRGIWVTEGTPGDLAQLQVKTNPCSGNTTFDLQVDVAAADVFGNRVGTSNTTSSVHVSGVSADRGDTNRTLQIGVDAKVQRWATALSANRVVTLSATGATEGDTFRIVRTGLGAFTLDVGGLRTIPNTTAAFVDVTFNGTAWLLTGYGTL